MSKNHLKPNDGQSTSISNQQQLIVVWTNIHNAQQEGCSSINEKREKNSLEKNEPSKSLHEIIESNDDDTIDYIIVERNQNPQCPNCSIVTNQSELVFKRDVILILKSWLVTCFAYTINKACKEGWVVQGLSKLCELGQQITMCFVSKLDVLNDVTMVLKGIIVNVI